MTGEQVDFETALNRAVESAFLKHSKPPIRNQIAFTAEQAAEACGLPYASILNAIDDGELKAAKRRRKWMIRRDALLRWLEG